MRKNEKDQQIKESEKAVLIRVQDFFGETPYEKDQNIEKYKKLILMNAWNIFGDTNFYFRNIPF